MKQMAWIEKRERAGEAVVWRVVWREQYAGKQQQTLATEEQAIDLRDAVNRAGNRWPKNWIKDRGWADQVASDAPLFRDYAKRTIDARPKADPRTRADYLGMLDKHVNPVIGNKPLDEIDRFDVVAVSQRALAAGKSPKTIANIHALLSSVLADAMQDEWVRRNVAKGTMPTLPDVKHESIAFLSHPEAGLVLDRIPEGVYRDLARLLFNTGLRWSEATALSVGDVDLLDRKSLRVRRAWKYRDGHFVLGEPKTGKSRRTLPLSGELVRLLTPYAARLDSSEFLFTTENGRPVRHSNFYNRIWKPAVAAARRCQAHAAAEDPCGCPGTLTKSPRIHDARHTHASWLLADKVTMLAIQERLGHESILTTMGLYAHLAPEHADEINASVDKSFARS